MHRTFNCKKAFSAHRSAIFSKRNFGATYTFILICIILPCLISTIALTGMSAATLAKLTDTTNDFAVQAMHSTATYNESSLNLVKNAVSTLTLNPLINEALSSKGTTHIEELSHALKTLTTTNKYVVNTYIIDTNTMSVYSDKGITSASNYYRDDCVYNSYSISYWNDFAFYSAETNRILAPCNMILKNEKYAVIPIVFRTADSMASKKYLIADIDIKSVMQIPDYRTFGNTKFYVFNKFSNDIFSLGNNDDNLENFDSIFITYIKEHPNANFNYKTALGKMIVSTISENNSLIGYTYIAVTPIWSLYENIIPYIAVMVLLNLLCIVVIVLMSTKNANKIYKPIKNAWISLSPSNNNSSNMLFDIERLSNDAKLEIDRLTTIIPSAQRNYLVNMLNNVDYWNNSEANKLIEKSFDFKHKYFSVVLLQLSPALDFHDRFNDSEYETIKQGFYEVVCSIFDEHFDTYVLPAENNILNIVLNHQTVSSYSQIKDLLRVLLGYLKNDFEYITVSIGVSSAHAGIEGLKDAHNEAMNEFIPYNTPSSEPLISGKKSNLVFTNSDETALYTALSSSSKQEIEEIIDNFMVSYSCSEVSDIKTLYNYIINTMLKFIHINNISYKEEMLDFEIIAEILSKDVMGIKTDIGYLIDRIIKARQTLPSFDEIYNYIKENFSSYDLSLKQLSDIFSMSQSNITRMAQANTGLSFKELLNTMRIETAKEFLRDTDKSIDTICELCGFSNQRTFYRIFKQITGMSPAKYRGK